MPLNRYFKGKGRGVMRSFQKRYGKKQGQRAFYATVNKMRKGSKKQRSAQPKRAPGARRKATRKKK